MGVKRQNRATLDGGTRRKKPLKRGGPRDHVKKKLEHCGVTKTRGDNHTSDRGVGGGDPQKKSERVKYLGGEKTQKEPETGLPKNVKTTTKKKKRGVTGEKVWG